MSEEWRRVRLGNVLDVKHGYAFESKHFDTQLTGRPIVVNIGNFAYTGGFRFASTQNREFRGPYPKEFELSPGDLLIVMTCQTAGGEILGIPAFVPNDGRTYLHNQRIGKVLVDATELDATFAYYLFLSSDVNRQLAATATGTKILHTSPDRIRDVAVVLPDVSQQRVIAQLLRVLDDKIEANDELARRADELWAVEMARVVNGWDVPDEPLPVGWSRVPLSSLARFVNGRNFTKGATGSGRMVVRIAELNTGPGLSTVYNEIDVPSDHVVRIGDLLFSWSGSLTVQRWYRSEAIVNQHIFKVIPRPDTSMWLVHGYLLRLLPWYRQVAADKATTMGHIQRHHLDEPVVLPDSSTLQKLDARCAPLWNRALTAERESLILAELRDTLLPRMLSGELQVRQAEELVGEAV